MNSSTDDSWEASVAALPSSQDLGAVAFEILSDFEVHTRQELLAAFQKQFNLMDKQMRIKRAYNTSSNTVIGGRWHNIRTHWQDKGYIASPRRGSYQLTHYGYQELSIKYDN